MAYRKNTTSLTGSERVSSLADASITQAASAAPSISKAAKALREGGSFKQGFIRTGTRAWDRRLIPSR